MTILPYTTQALLRAGYSPERLERAANACFKATAAETEQVSVRTVQHFWDSFVDAHAKIYRGGALQEAA